MRSSTWLANQSIAGKNGCVGSTQPRSVRAAISKRHVGLHHACWIEHSAGGACPRRAASGYPSHQRSTRRCCENRRQENQTEQIDKNAYRHPVVRERAPRDMPKRRAPGRVACNFILPRMIVEGLTFLARSMADRERAERLDEARGFRRRYPKTKNFYVTEALNSLLADYGLSQFCVPEGEPVRGRVRRFAVPTAAGGPFDSLCSSK